MLSLEHLLTVLIHAVLMMVLFRKMENHHPFLCNLPLLLLFLEPFIRSNEALRGMMVLLQLLVGFLYLTLRTEGSWKTNLYCSLVQSNLLCAVQFCAPRILSFCFPSLEQKAAIAAVWGSMLLLYLLGTQLIPFSRIKSVGLSRFLVMAIISLQILLGKFVTDEAMGLSGKGLSNTAFLFYQVSVCLLFLVVTLCLDNYLERIEAEKENEILLQSKEQQMKRMEMEKKATDNVLQLYHDLRKHLEVIGRQSSKEQQQYLGELSEELNLFRDMVKTGDETIDGLIMAKVVQFNGTIRFSVAADFSPLTFLSPMDKVSIFGNALDNAVESCLAFKEKEAPFIDLRSWRYGDYLVVKVSNSASKEIKANTILRTSKKEGLHGIGMKSIRSALDKHSATMAYEAKNGVFTLKMMIPLPAEEA